VVPLLGGRRTAHSVFLLEESLTSLAPPG
jgi:hypothetical protein